MKKNTIVTILLLLLVIGLTVALVMTNLPKGSTTQEPDIQKQEVTESSKTEDVVIGSIALDSEVAQKIARTVALRDFFASNKGVVTQNDLTDEDKMLFAYIYGARTKETSTDYTTYYLDKSVLDEYMIELFGNADYTPAKVNAFFYTLEYDSQTQRFSHYQGGGGGGPQALTGVYKVDEYADRYEAYVKYLVVMSSSFQTGNGLVELYNIRPGNSILVSTIGSYKGSEEQVNAAPTKEELIASATIKNFASYIYNNGSVDIIFEADKLLSVYYDQAGEYKVTFMKNDDGTIYWAKSECIK